MYSLVNHFTQPLLCCSVRAASDNFSCSPTWEEWYKHKMVSPSSLKNIGQKTHSL